MSRRHSTEQATPALEDRADLAAPFEPAPILFWNPCMGVPLIVIESSRQFAVGQAFVLALGVSVVFVVVCVS
jgi:hypothetical protein